MSLDNLLGKSLEKITPDAATIQRLLVAAERNIADYSGDLIPESTLQDCIVEAEKLLVAVRKWLCARLPH